MLYNKLRVINVLYTVYNQNSPYVVSDSQFADAIFTGQSRKGKGKGDTDLYSA